MSRNSNSTIISYPVDKTEDRHKAKVCTTVGDAIAASGSLPVRRKVNPDSDKSHDDWVKNEHRDYPPLEANNEESDGE